MGYFFVLFCQVHDKRGMYKDLVALLHDGHLMGGKTLDTFPFAATLRYYGLLTHFSDANLGDAKRTHLVALKSS